MMSSLAQFTQTLKRMQNVVVLTGAGVSAESGIPTFRGEGGLWRKHSAFDLATLRAFDNDPSLVWQFYHYRRCVVSKCKPNPAHYAITDLQQKFMENNRNFNVITQNIDGLHITANTTDLIEMHGSLWNVKPQNHIGHTLIDNKYVWEDRNIPICQGLDGTENNISDTENVEDNKVQVPVEELPHDSRGNLLRPAVVWFGEPLDTKVMDRCMTLMENCDMLIIVGTSGVVYPAAGFSEVVMNNYMNSFVAEFNLKRSPNSDMFDFVFEGKAGELLPDAFNVGFD